MTYVIQNIKTNNIEPIFRTIQKLNPLRKLVRQTNLLQSRGGSSNTIDPFFVFLIFSAITYLILSTNGPETFYNQDPKFLGDNKTKIQQLKDIYWNIEDPPHVSQVIYKQDTSCKATANIRKGIIKIGGCPHDFYYRGLVITQEDWILFTFLHEIGHIELKTDNECEADNYAYQESIRQGAIPIRYQECKHEE